MFRHSLNVCCNWMRRDMVGWMWSLIAVMVRFILQYFYSEQFWVPLQLLEIFRKWNLITNNYAMPFYNPHALTVASDRSLFREKLFFFVRFFSLKVIHESYTSQDNLVPRLFTRFRLITWSSKLLCIGGGVAQTNSTYLTYFCLRN